MFLSDGSVHFCGCSLSLAAAVSLALAPAHADEKTVQLPAYQVSGAALDGTTEGTGAYATGSTSTATGLALSPRDTPQSVTVVTRQRMEDQALQTISDVVNGATGISAKPYDSARQGFSARGFAIDNLMVDGMPTSWEPGWSAGETQTDTVIYDRVEIVRGATGLMTGAGNPSAAINLRRKHATSREFVASVSGAAGSWDEYRGEVDLSAPLSPSGAVRGRLVAAYRQADSFVDYAEERRRVFYGVIDADLTEATQLSVGASQQENRPRGSTWGGLPAWFADGTRTDWDRDDTTAARWSAWSSQHESWFVSLGHSFASGWRVDADYSRSVNDGRLRLLFLYGYPDAATGLGMGDSPGGYDTRREQDNYGLRLTGPFQLLGRQHELGLGYLRNEQTLDALGREPDSFPGVGSFFQWDGNYPEPGWGPPVDYDNYDKEQSGFYAVARFNLADSLKLIAGARLSNWEQRGVGWNGESYVYEVRDELTPYIGLVYDMSSALSLYASYTDIFQPQDARDINGKLLDPVTGEALELGVKGSFFDSRLSASAAIFRIEQDNLAQEAGQIPGALETYYVAAEGATSEGYELELTGALTADWEISLGWSHFIAEDAAGADINTSHPRRLLKLFTRYRLPGRFNRLLIGGGVNWQSDNYTIASNPFGVDEKLEQSSYALVELMARYQFSDRLSAQLNLNNLLDEEYYSQIGFYSQLAHGEPRSALLTLKYQF